jgi:adenosylcobinamide-phosphate synthase
MIRQHALALALALVFDFFLGDWEKLPHPVRWMGKAYAHFETFFKKRRALDYGNGIITVLWIGSFFALIPFLILMFIKPEIPRVLIEGFLLYWCLSIKNLADESIDVYQALHRQRMPQARKCLARIVGRDTDKLTVSEIARAVVETIGESFVDGFLSPVFWGLLLGAPGAFFFKAVSTGDSMIGHPEPPYKKFGWATARLDDVLNWIPARLCSLFLMPASVFCGLSPKGLFRTFWQDRLKHKSPNAAHGEAAFAGALGVKLGGANRYGGKVYSQAFLNASGRPCGERDILKAVSLLWFGAVVVFLFLLGVGKVWLL